MAKQEPAPGSRPRVDDRKLWDVVMAVAGYPMVLAARQMKLFELLGEKPLTLDEVCATKHIARRPALAVLAICASLGLIALRDGRYALTEVAEDYLLPSSPTYFGWLYDVWTPLVGVFTPETLLKAVTTDRPQGPFADPVGAFGEWYVEQATNFIRAMHSVSVGPSLEWPRRVDLSRNRMLLDVGGGSAVHSIGALTVWPNLKATIMDQPAVCELARHFAAQQGVADRIATQAGNFFEDPFPAADLHFYSQIFHDWPADRCRFLARKSFENLPAGGRIIVHEVLLNDDLSGPFAAAALNVTMLIAAPPGAEQLSGRQIREMLEGAGFGAIEVIPSFGYWSIVTGVKP
ncbi:MAG TPA: methyltransferase [Candidatus Binataceae bacterium]|nr:methyltransferase [Candidatus Binataceae bacterium]